MVTLCNRYGEKMIWIITAGWILIAFLMHRIGYESGVAKGTEFTLQTLTRQRIIMVDTKTQEICPGDTRKHVKHIVD